MLLLTQARRRIHLRKGGKKKKSRESEGEGQEDRKREGENSGLRRVKSQEGLGAPTSIPPDSQIHLSISQYLPILVLSGVSDFPLAMEDIG